VIEAIKNSDNTALLALIAEQQSQLEQKDLRISKLEHQLEQMLRAYYGKKSERFILQPGPDQIPLPLDVESTPASEVKKETITYERKKPSGKSNHKGRLALPEHLEREIIILAPDYNTEGMVKIGEEVSEHLEFAPGKVYVKRVIRPKYAKPDGEGVIIAPMPSMPIERGVAGPGLLANILIEKYVDHLPLYRQIERYKREGVVIPSSTLSDWIARCGQLLEPLYETLKRKVIDSGYLQADETPIKVIDRNIKGKTHLGFYWVYRDPQNDLVLFDYRKGRSREGPGEILKGFEGFLQSDGWSAYENFDNGKITLFHCMAHARRYFDQAKDNDAARSEYFLKEIQKLYAVEKRAREENLNHAQRFELRQQQSLSVLRGLDLWLKENITQVLSQSAIGKAIAYSCSRWDKLMLYTSDGKLEIDNNLVENSIRPIAIGRKNYLFAGSHAAAQRAAMIYSLLGTCKLKGIEPFEWLKNILQVLPDHKANRLQELLP
jgi:transposase